MRYNECKIKYLIGNGIMALVKCPECGREISDKADECIKCGYPLKEMKHKKRLHKYGKIMLMIFAAVIIIFLLFVISDKIGLFHKHKFENATCIKPKTCIECGKIEGDVTEHIPSIATCTESSTCKICGHVVSSALGHTASFGRCDRCNAIQGQEWIDKIEGYLLDANYYIDSATKLLESEKDIHSILDNILSFYELANKYYQDAYFMCMDYEILSELKKNLKKLLAIELDKNDSSGQINSEMFLDNIKEYIALKEICELDIQDIKRDFF